MSAPNACSVYRSDSNATSLPLVLACDHASNAIPAELAGLGLTADKLTRHIAWDIGAADLARALADRLGCTAVLANWSRLVIDCNRALTDPTSIVAMSDGISIPGNAHLPIEARRERAQRFWAPYHARLEHELMSRVMGTRVPVLIAIHSFTPVFGGARRVWHAGVLWDRDPRIAVPLIARLRAETGLVVGDNEPYSGRHPADYTIDSHAEARGWPHVSIEVRQDLIGDSIGATQWADRLYRCLAPILADPALYQAIAAQDESEHMRAAP